ncbi:TolC family protein [Olivibacter sp. SDN3]|uniref:TolC family protein n=1 Tax=Olivibacter sp. SDN3 TaxID=2764720 RepID=UPI0016517422|nr:TolC family protein [Olivibacter sp. SDN3]QNL49845.1 TolC family protein [Olivibacter sp. SDN3]
MKLKILFFVAAVAVATSSHAQIEVTPPLQEAVRKAIEKNASIRNKNLEVEKINTEKQSVWNKYVPKVEGSASYLYFDTKVTLDLPTERIPIIDQPIYDGKTSMDNNGNILAGSLMAKTVLFSGFQIENGAKALEQKRIGTAYLSEAEKESLVKDVIASFDQIHLLDELEKLVDDSEKRLAMETKRIERAIAEGLAIPYDRDKIKLANLELQAKKIELRGKRKVLYQKINYLTGYSENQIGDVRYLLKPYIIQDDLSVENKQELRALESFKKASDYMIKKEKGSYLPVLGAFGGLAYTSLFNANMSTPAIPILGSGLHGRVNEFTLSPNWMVGLSMKWEIFSGFERKHKIHEAKLSSQQVQNQLDDTKEKFSLLLANNLSDYRLQNQKYQNGLEQEKVAFHNLDKATKQYQEGLISISERLEAENDLLKASTNKIQTLIDQRLSALEALSVTGELNKTVLR